MKKKITFIFAIILMLNFYTVNAQKKDGPIINLEHMDKKKYQWGYYFGTNNLDFKFDMKRLNYKNGPRYKNWRDIQVKKHFGFNIGIMGSIRITDQLHLRAEPGLVYNQRDLVFPGFNEEEEKKDAIREVRSTYIYVPLLLKVSTKRWFNFKPYITGGTSVTYNLSSSSNFKKDNSEGIFRMKDFSFFYELGTGIDFYTPYFRISPSIRGIFSIANEIIPDNPRVDGSPSPWTGNINRIRTQGILINIILE